MAHTRRRHGGRAFGAQGHAGVGRGPRPVNPLLVEVSATDGPARTGRVITPRRRTGRRPSCPWAPGERSRAWTAPTSRHSGAEVVLANTYHLMLRPGAETVAALGGLHRFTGWNGHTLTDSGGFQVHSLRPKVDDDGVTFASVYDGAAVRLDARVGGRGPGPHRGRHPDGARRVRHPAGHPRGAAGGRRPHRGVGGPGPGPPRSDRVPSRGPGAVRHRPGGHRRPAPDGERRAHGGAGLRRLRHRRAVGGGAAPPDARRPGRHRARCCRSSSPGT